MSKCYIGRKSCGCVVAAVVADIGSPKEVAKDVASFIESGLTIELVDTAYVRDNLRSCKCKNPTIVESVEHQEIMGLEC